MDWLTFISSIIGSLAWPVAAVLLIFLLREEITKILPIVKKVKAGPLEAEFERDVQNLKDSASNSVQDAIPDTASKTFLIQLAALHPRSAILESWVRVEAAARALLASKSDAFSKSTYVPAAGLSQHIENTGALDQRLISLFDEIRSLRNDVAHERGLEPTIESSRNYIDLASYLQGKLESQTS